MSILIYGAGVIGSYYASTLHAGGVDATLLARGARLHYLQEHGVVLDHYLQATRTAHRVPVVSELKPSDEYEFVVVVMRKTQLPGIWPALRANTACQNVVFLGNTHEGFAPYEAAIGKGRVVLGFGSAGGTRENQVVTTLHSARSKTTVGEADGTESPRLQRFRDLLGQAGLGVDISPDIDAWLKYHLALILPMALGVYQAGGSVHRLARAKPLVRRVVDAVHEGFAGLRARGHSIQPKGLKKLKRVPRFLARFLLRKFLDSRKGELALEAHANAAREEMGTLAREFGKIITRGSLGRPPAYSALLEGIGAPGETPPGNENGRGG